MRRQPSTCVTDAVVLMHSRQGWNSRLPPRHLALIIACLESDTDVRSGRINRAAVVRQKRTRAPAHDHHATSHVILQTADDRFWCLLGELGVRGNKPWFAQDVQLSRLDDQVSVAACSTLVTESHVSRGTLCESLQKPSHVFAGCRATGERPDHRWLLGFGSGRINDVPQRVPFTMASHDCRRRRGRHFIRWIEMLVYHAATVLRD